MSLMDIIRSGVALADNITKGGGMQCSVKFERCTSTSGERAYAGPVYLDALVDLRAQQVRTQDGIVTAVKAAVMFLNIAALESATNSRGIQNNDKITLPDGTTGPTLTKSGFMDPAISSPAATEVYIG